MAGRDRQTCGAPDPHNEGRHGGREAGPPVCLLHFVVVLSRFMFHIRAHQYHLPSPCTLPCRHSSWHTLTHPCSLIHVIIQPLLVYVPFAAFSLSLCLMMLVYSILLRQMPQFHLIVCLISSAIPGLPLLFLLSIYYQFYVYNMTGSSPVLILHH